GQFTMAKAPSALEDAVRGALAAKVNPREIIEIILHCAVYGGQLTVDPAIEVFHHVAEELGLIEELRKSQLPVDGRDSERNYEAERKSWHPDDVADPRVEAVMKRHGWLALGPGLRLRPRHHLDVVANYDAMDSGWADLWVK